MLMVNGLWLMFFHRIQRNLSAGGAFSKMAAIGGHGLVAIVLIITVSASPAGADDSGGPAPTHENEGSILSSPLTFFQRVISKADGNRCPMYPSCSHYAATAFQQHNPLTAWILTCDRLLRCGHDETRLAPRVYVAGQPHAYDPVEANTFWWRKP